MENTKEVSNKKQFGIHVVSTRYSKNDVRKYTDGWWITSFNKTRKQRIKLIGSFKTRQLAENEREVLNVC
tara:strand:- start:1383 stop:1592 length:210 start_codon:yes stop_codon:yes gene_type:complete